MHAAVIYNIQPCEMERPCFDRDGPNARDRDAQLKPITTLNGKSRAASVTVISSPSDNNSVTSFSRFPLVASCKAGGAWKKIGFPAASERDGFDI